MPKPATTRLLLQFRDKDTKFGVSRRTVRRLSDALGLTDTETTLLALAKLRDSMLPTYPADDGELTKRQIEAIRKIESQSGYTPTRSLFEGV